MEQWIVVGGMKYDLRNGLEIDIVLRFDDIHDYHKWVEEMDRRRGAKTGGDIPQGAMMMEDKRESSEGGRFTRSITFLFLNKIILAEIPEQVGRDFGRK
jgi:hypothetical protein